MRQDAPDIHLSPVIVDRGNKPVLIAADIKDSEPIDVIDAVECRLQLSKGSEIVQAHQRVPCRQWCLGVWISRPECDEQGLGYDMHRELNIPFWYFVNPSGHAAHQRRHASQT
jgi:hypothetical protein